MSLLTHVRKELDYKSMDTSDILQFDGNVSIESESSLNNSIPQPSQPPKVKVCDKITAALYLPTVAAYNLRSLFPKVGNLTTDILERSIDVSFCTEIWEQEHNKEHQLEIEKLAELSGLKYLSTPRKPNSRGVSYGGAALVVNMRNFNVEKIPVNIPQNLEVVWALLKPKNKSAKFKRIIICSFYSPPSKRRNSKMADHVVSTLQMLAATYPESGIIIGGDKNYMNISPVLNCGLRLKQCNDKATRQGVILDIIITNLYPYYNSPTLAPPIQPDNPDMGKPSDHWVPICTPHTDRFKPPRRTFRTVKFRPLPASSISKFGEWIVSEKWENISRNCSPSEQAQEFQSILQDKLDLFLPVKTFKISSQDKPWITKELKIIHRQKSREWVKRGKSAKYIELAKKFDEKYKHEAGKYLHKNLDELMDCQPGRAYRILNKMGAQPGDCTDSNSFTLQQYESESLTAEESAERIASYFAHISQKFPPISVQSLPPHVQSKLQGVSQPPTISEYDAYLKIRKANKPKTGVPGDLPREIIKEFSPELAKPVSILVNNIVHNCEWPNTWKLEWVTPIGKIPTPETEEDLRPISLTPFFSKVAEHFVVEWLLKYIKDKIDFRQYGGMKGNSTTHYIIEFINFILLNQDSKAQTAILACMVDYSKAFNRQNHNILITKLSDMGVPAWLLKVVMAFLSNRKMKVRYKGKLSSTKDLPGGGPQGTLLGLLLFLVLINDAGFQGQLNNAGELLTSRRNLKKANEIHLKYVDDLTLAEAVNLPEKLVPVNTNERPLPDTFHARTGHSLPAEKSAVQQQLIKINQHAIENEMQINLDKSKVILFNPCNSIDFMPKIELNGSELDLVEKIKLLGIVIRSDLKWSDNTDNMIKRAYKNSGY